MTPQPPTPSRAETGPDEGARQDAGRPAGEPTGRMPDFFIVGHPKCGTTALHQMLIRHPQIHMPLKEPRFFAPELRSRFRRLGPRKLPESLDDYLALFAAAAPDQLVGEASPQYLRSRSAAAAIARAQPRAKLIALLREPASFLRSFHLQAVNNAVETETDFGAAIALEPARRRGRRIPLLSQAPGALLYSDHVRYVEQLQRLHEAFPRDQVLILIYDDLLSDNEGTVRRVLRFLDVDDDLAIEPVRTPALAAVRSPTLYRAGMALSPLRRRLIPDPTWRRMVYRDPDPADPELMAALRVRFKPEVVALSDYLDRDLVTEWGYDVIG